MTAPSADIPLNPEQEQLVRMNLHLVEECAAELVRTQGAKRDGLLGPGTIALCKAASRYRKNRHPSFPQYARPHVRGRMRDALRAERYSASARTEDAIERMYDRMMSHQVLDVDMFADEPEELLKAARGGCAELLVGGHIAGLLEEQKVTPEDHLSERQEQQRVLTALLEARARLTPERKAVVELLFEGDLTVDDAASEIGVSSSTVERRLASALDEMRAFLGACGVAAGHIAR